MLLESEGTKSQDGSLDQRSSGLFGERPPDPTRHRAASPASSNHSGSAWAERRERGRERLHESPRPQDWAHRAGQGPGQGVRAEDQEDDRGGWSGGLEGLFLRLAVQADAPDAGAPGSGIRAPEDRRGEGRASPERTRFR